MVKNSLFRYEKSFKLLSVARSFFLLSFAVDFLDFVKMNPKKKNLNIM